MSTSNTLPSRQLTHCLPSLGLTAPQRHVHGGKDAPTRLLPPSSILTCGINMPSQAARALCLSPDKLQPLTQINVHFPSSAAAFKEEVLAQARELYGGRTSVNMDSLRVLHGVYWGLGHSHDTPDFCTRLAFLSNAPPLHPCAPLDYSEFAALLCHGSDATSLDEPLQCALCHCSTPDLPLGWHYVFLAHCVTVFFHLL
jgi:hypothetical protein